MPAYTLTTTVPLPPAETEALTRDALLTQGFGVLTEIDVAATMKAKLGVDQPPYIILGACNPPLAHRALTVEPAVGALLPCNVVVRAADAAGTHTIVEAIDPTVISTVGEAAELADVARTARDKLAAALGMLPTV